MKKAYRRRDSRHETCQPGLLGEEPRVERVRAWVQILVDGSKVDVLILYPNMIAMNENSNQSQQ
jgi:hypothetical protein